MCDRGKGFALDSDSEGHLITTMFQPGDSELTTLEVGVADQGIYFILTTPRENATSAIVTWETLAELVIESNPDIFGALDEPWHRGFQTALESLGYDVS